MGSSTYQKHYSLHCCTRRQLPLEHTTVRVSSKTLGFSPCENGHIFQHGIKNCPDGGDTMYMLQTFDNKNVQNWQLDSTDPERVYGFEKIMPDFSLDPFVVMQSAIKASDNGFFSDRPKVRTISVLK
jgi:hypothetical protein